MSARASTAGHMPGAGALTRRSAIDDLLPAAGATAQGEGPMLIAWRRLRADRLAIVATSALVVMFVICFSAGWFETHWAHRSFDQQNLSVKVGGTEVIDLRGMPKIGPGVRTEYTLGADPLGRDLFMRVLRGGKVSLLVGFVSAIITVTFALLFGMWAGFRGGTIDRVISNVFDVMLGFPFMLFAIALSTALATSDGFWIIQRGTVSLQILLLGTLVIAYFGRIVRGETRSLGQREFVEAARALGASNARIIGRHILPHLSTVVLTYFGLLVAANILAEAALSFLGVGVLPPTPSWGNIIADGKIFYSTAWWVAFFPGLFIAITVVCLNMLGQSLEEAFDPKGIGGK